MSKLLTVCVLSCCLFVAACADEKVNPQKSPCVGLDNSPCGPKRPVNGKLHNVVQATPAYVVQYA